MYVLVVWKIVRQVLLLSPYIFVRVNDLDWVLSTVLRKISKILRFGLKEHHILV